MATRDAELLEEASGLEALEEKRVLRRGWRVLWPPLAATALFLLAWQAVVWSGWKPPYVLPGPITVIRRLASDIANGEILRAIATTMRRGASGYTLAVLIGGAIGIAVARLPLLRAAIGSMITGLQTMPSVAWFPLAIVLFTLGESAILFVVVLGAAPSVANGLISGIDHVPPILLRAGDVLGARGLSRYRYVVLPAALPSAIAGLKQAWAFAWRSLMAGELLLVIASKPSLGSRLDNTRTLADFEGMIATMLVIFVIGVVVDSVLFRSLERRVRARRGLLVT